MKDILFHNDLKSRVRELEEELEFLNNPSKVDPAILELMKKIDEAIEDFHTPKLELVVANNRLIDY